MFFAFSVGAERAVRLPGFQFQVGCANRRSVIQKMRSNLHRSKEKMPCNIHGGVEQGGSKNRAGLAPGPAVEKTGDGGQDYITPVGEAHVGDVRKEAENAERNEGQRLELRPLRVELNEVYCLAQWNADASENDETCGDEKAPMVAPPDGVGDAIDATQKQETSKCDVDAEEDSENVGKTAARVRPEPV